MPLIAEKLHLKRHGESDYGITFFPDEPKRRLVARVIGRPVRPHEWVWSVYINGKLLHTDETLTRKKDAVRALSKDLERRGLIELVEEAENASEAAEETEEDDDRTVTLSEANKMAMEAAKRAAAETHPLFTEKTPNGGRTRRGRDKRLNMLIRVCGTTLVGNVVEVVNSTQTTRYKVEFPAGTLAWVEEKVTEAVTL